MTSNDIAIKVENVSKRYRIGSKEEIKENFASAIFEFIKSPLKNYRKYRSLYKFDDINPESNSNSSDIIWALRDVSFEVTKGEVLGIIGRNGAGKSTLLKILARITDPTNGRAEIIGRISSLLEVGTGFHPELTGRENVYLNGIVLGMTKAEVHKKFDEIVEFSGVKKFIDTPVKRYSSGMKLRLAFSVAAHLDPEILIIDEVLAVGDIAFQKKCISKMEDVSHKGRTILFVSHNLPAVRSLCSRAIFLENGKVAYSGPTEEAINYYSKSSAEIVQKQNLLHRKDRQGGDLFRFSRVDFIDPHTKSPLDTIFSGTPLLIKIGYFCESPTVLEDANIAISFFTEDGTLLFACPSQAVGKTFRIVNGEWELFCKIPKCPLKAGRYAYTLRAEFRGSCIDWVKQAGYLDVEAGDYYGTGKIPGRAHQYGILLDYDWSEK